MPATYVLLAHTSLSTTASEIVFNSIDQTYTDLVIVGNFRNTSGNELCNLRFNGDTATNYSYIRTQAVGGSLNTIDDSAAFNRIIGGICSTYGQSAVVWDIFNYSSTSIKKSVLVKGGYSHTGSGTAVGLMVCNLWNNTNAITDIRVFPDAGSFSAGSTATMYGIKKA